MNGTLGLAVGAASPRVTAGETPARRMVALMGTSGKESADAAGFVARRGCDTLAEAG